MPRARPASSTRHRDAQRAYLLEHPLAFTVACWATCSAIALLSFPSLYNDSALHQIMEGGGEKVWTVIYLSGGVTMGLGMLRLSPRLEAVGCWLLGGTQLVNIYAIVTIRGTGAALISGASGALAIGLVGRALILSRRFPAD